MMKATNSMQTPKIRVFGFVILVISKGIRKEKLPYGKSNYHGRHRSDQDRPHQE